MACQLNRRVYDSVDLALPRHEAATLISTVRRLQGVAEPVVP